jgi:hypothetical protein
MRKKRIKQEIETSKDFMQKILNEWLALGLGPCMGLNDLVLRPRAVFEKATKLRQNINPSILYDLCKLALTRPYCAMYGIFIVNDTQVEIDEQEINEIWLLYKKYT